MRPWRLEKLVGYLDACVCGVDLGLIYVYVVLVHASVLDVGIPRREGCVCGVGGCSLAGCVGID